VTPALSDDGIQLVLVRRGAHHHLSAVVEQNAQFLNIIDGLAGRAGNGYPQELFPIIPPSVQRLCVEGSGPNVELVFFGLVSQRVQHDPWLNSCESSTCVQLENLFMYLVKSSTTATLQH